MGVSSGSPVGVELVQQVLEVAQLAVHHAVIECMCGLYVLMVPVADCLAADVLDVDRHQSQTADWSAVKSAPPARQRQPKDHLCDVYPLNYGIQFCILDGCSAFTPAQA